MNVVNKYVFAYIENIEEFEYLKSVRTQGLILANRQATARQAPVWAPIVMKVRLQDDEERQKRIAADQLEVCLQ
jgi:hypothetical protein